MYAFLLVLFSIDVSNRVPGTTLVRKTKVQSPSWFLGFRPEILVETRIRVFDFPVVQFADWVSGLKWIQ
jgi:hypothetical protein